MKKEFTDVLEAKD